MYLLWILSVFAIAAATAGSRVKMEIEERHENGWNFEHEGLLETDNGKWKKEEDSQPLQKREVLTIATVVAAGATSIGSLSIIADKIGSADRKIAIDIENLGPNKWESVKTYFFSGTSDKVLPQYVPAKKALIYTARKTSGAAAGAVGVVSLYIPKERLTLSVLFSVPYDQNLYPANYWNVKIYRGRKVPNYDTYNDLYYKFNPYKGDHSWQQKGLGWCYIVNGVMTDSGTAALKVVIKKVIGCDK